MHKYLEAIPLAGMLFVAFAACLPKTHIVVYVLLAAVCLAACLSLCYISLKWEKEWQIEQKARIKTSRRNAAPGKNNTKASASKPTSSKSCVTTKNETQSCRKKGSGKNAVAGTNQRNADSSSITTNPNTNKSATTMTKRKTA